MDSPGEQLRRSKPGSGAMSDSFAGRVTQSRKPGPFTNSKCWREEGTSGCFCQSVLVSQPVPQKLVAKIQSGEFVDMAELLMDRMGLSATRDDLIGN